MTTVTAVVTGMMVAVLAIPGAWAHDGDVRRDVRELREDRRDLRQDHRELRRDRRHPRRDVRRHRAGH
jgi:hypothetical protein